MTSITYADINSDVKLNDDDIDKVDVVPVVGVTRPVIQVFSARRLP